MCSFNDWKGKKKKRLSSLEIKHPGLDSSKWRILLEQKGELNGENEFTFAV